MLTCNKACPAIILKPNTLALNNVLVDQFVNSFPADGKIVTIIIPCAAGCLGKLYGRSSAVGRVSGEV